jgi:hypothetical protein
MFTNIGTGNQTGICDSLLMGKLNCGLFIHISKLTFRLDLSSGGKNWPMRAFLS